MKEISRTTAQSLLQIKAIRLNPSSFFTWASGLRSPIYCDNRTTLSFTAVRSIIYKNFARIITETYPNVEIIAGVATGGIVHGVLVAEELNKPFIYVRPTPKKHGLANQIEGVYHKGAKVVVIEDLISTGGSSLNAVEALREAGCEVLGMTAIFTYGFEIAAKNFAEANVELHTLTNYEDLMEIAVEQNYIDSSDLEILRKWRNEIDENK